MDVGTDPFSFDQMRDQLDGIQQTNSNYKKTSLYVLDHTPQHKILRKKWRIPYSKPNQDMLRFRIYERRILRIIETNMI